jgi:DNA-binding helix-hairpin-helix protein with protein kinase domain
VQEVVANIRLLSTVIATGFAFLSLGDMMLTNRRKKTSWIAEQQANYDRALALARQAEADGTLTDDLRMFLVKEHAIDLAEKEQKERGGVFERAKKTVYEGFSKEEKAGGRLSEMLTKEDRARRVSNEEMSRIMPGEAQGMSDRNLALARQSAVQEARNEASREAVGAVRPVGGKEGALKRELDPSKQYNKSNVMPANTIARETHSSGVARGGYLDQLAANSASAMLNTARGWTGR